MLRKGLLLAVSILLFSPMINAQNIGVGQWRVHFPFNNPLGFEMVENSVFTWGDKGFFRYDRESKEIKVLSKIDGYSDVGVSTMHYHEASKTLLIAYQSSNIDLLVNREKLILVPDIALSSINGSREINHIASYNEYALISCGFGIQVYNLNRKESSATWRSTLFTNVNAACVFQNKAYAATPSGIYEAPIPVAGISINPGSWTQVLAGNTTLMDFSGPKLFAVVDSVLMSFDGNTWQQEAQYDDYRKLKNYDDKLFLTIDSGLYTIENGNLSFKVEEGSRQALRSKGELFFASFGFGLIRKDAGGSLDYISPSGPYGLATGKMVSKGNKIYIGGGKMLERGASSYTLNGYYIFEDGKWTNSRSTPNSYLDTFRDIHAIEIGPSGDLWVAGLFDGIIRLRGNQVLENYVPSNSPLKTEVPQLITAIQFDDQKNLWVSNFESQTPLLVKTYNGVWDSFSLGNATTILDMIIARDGAKWMKLRDKTGVSAGIMVFDDNGTPLDHSDDPSPKYLGTGSGLGGLPSAEVRCLTKDRSGQIWVGTSKGLAVFYSPSNIFSASPSDAKQIVVGEGDNVGYLLGDEEINVIYVDGGNRKWIASRSGLWLVSPDGQEIISHFTEDNSPLLSNEINYLGMVESTGELFISTSQGLISYRTDATTAEDVHKDVKVFPNPVRPEYKGPITVSGLPQDAFVKITDIAGNLIYETQANGGTVTWDGNSFDGRRASSGVYLVFSGNKDASDTFVSKILFIAK